MNQWVLNKASSLLFALLLQTNLWDLEARKGGNWIRFTHDEPFMEKNYKCEQTNLWDLESTKGGNWIRFTHDEPFREIH